MTTDSNRPSHNALVVTNPERRKGEDPYFKRIGAAWPTKDGKGYYIKLYAFPVNGEIVLKEPLEDDDQDRGR